MGGRRPCCSEEGLNKGPWSAIEDRILTDYIKAHGEGRWGKVPKRAGLNRCGRSCRLRWLNYLRPDIKRGNISHEEEDLIIRLHKLLGNRWSLIAGRLPGRTDNEIKNYWNTVLKKKVQAGSVPLTNDEESKPRSKITTPPPPTTTTVQDKTARCSEADASLNPHGNQNAHENGLTAPVIEELAPASSLVAPRDDGPSNLSTGFGADSLFLLPCLLDFKFFQPLGGSIQQDTVDCNDDELRLSFDDNIFENWIGTDHS